MVPSGMFGQESMSSANLLENTISSDSAQIDKQQDKQAKHGTAAEHVEETPMSSLMALIRPTEFGEIIEVIALIIEIIEHHQLIATVEHVGAKVNELTDLLEGNKEKNDDETSKSRRLTNERFPTFPSVERLSSYRSWLRTQLKTLD